MTEDEARSALLDFRHAYAREPLPDIQAGQLERLFHGHQPGTVAAVVGDLVARGLPRPSPVEMGALLRTKAGKTPWTGGRVRRPGPLLDEAVPDPDATPADEIPARVAAIRDALTHGGPADDPEEVLL